ncbi:MAG: hypothetical protein H6Q71_2430 [Firmicutes bacterium]|nr:hypothetical protein [Bacillota bacterium]
MGLKRIKSMTARLHLKCNLAVFFIMKMGVLVVDNVVVNENNELSKEELKEVEELLAQLPNIIEELERDASKKES